MFKKKSIFIKILIPVIIIMLLQTALIGSILFGYGIVDSLNEGAIDNIRGNAENRSLVLAIKSKHLTTQLSNRGCVKQM